LAASLFGKRYQRRLTFRREFDVSLPDATFTSRINSWMAHKGQDHGN
jgi:hypothetical protein